MDSYGDFVKPQVRGIDMGSPQRRDGDEDIIRELGLRLRNARARAGMTGADAAEAAGVSRQTISDIERGRTDAKATTLWRLINAYGCDANEVLREHGATQAQVVYELIQMTDGTTALRPRVM
jgi:transcriptional regulator with XRE-family HTH domain